MNRVQNLALALSLSLPFAGAGASGATLTQLFSFPCPNTQFGNCPDGYRPNILIQASDGNFYGAAQLTTMGTSNPQGGTLYRLTPEGQFSLLFRFPQVGNGAYPDGDNPADGFVEANDGFLYGTTFDGGSHNSGVLFRIGKDGKGFSVVHSFCSAYLCADGDAPNALILGHDGALYGTTLTGGSMTSSCEPYGGCGTVFRFTPSSGKFETLFTFGGSVNGGGFSAFPSGLLQTADGSFYGTMSRAVFRLTPSRKFSTVYTLGGANGLPNIMTSPVIEASNGSLYGSFTTYGENQLQFFRLSRSGASFRAFPSFGTDTNQQGPPALVQASDGNLWDIESYNNTIIAMSPASGAVLAAYSLDSIGASTTEASILQGADGKLYGTTILGGAVGGGKVASGTVWRLDAGLPAPLPTVAAFSPSAGSAGTAVTIRGDHFVGTKLVSFNGFSASFKILNTHFLTATVPPGATTGPIQVSNPGGAATSGTDFTAQ